MSRSKQTLPALESLRGQIDHWRELGTKRGAMPANFWAEAVVLSQEQGLYTTARGLGLSYDRLKLHVVETELEQLRAANATELVEQSGGPDVTTAGFVELCAGVGLAECAPLAEVELSRPDGARMSFRVSSGQPLDLAALTRSFLEGAR